MQAQTHTAVRRQTHVNALDWAPRFLPFRYRLLPDASVPVGTNAMPSVRLSSLKPERTRSRALVPRDLVVPLNRLPIYGLLILQL